MRSDHVVKHRKDGCIVNNPSCSNVGASGLDKIGKAAFLLGDLFNCIRDKPGAASPLLCCDPVNRCQSFRVNTG